MRFSFSALLAATLTLCATSLNAAPPNPAEIARMCEAELKLQAPRFDAFGATLSLTSKQKPVFEHWKDVMLAISKERGCVPPQMDYSLPTLRRLALEETILSRALAYMDREKPALTALNGVLSPVQREKFEHPQMAGAMAVPPHRN